MPLVMLTTFAAFLPSLLNGFVSWDDDKALIGNPHFRGLGWTHLKWMFTTFHMGPYQPLSWMTLGVDYLLWGMDPAGYHLTSLLLHACNAALLYLVLIQLLKRAMPDAAAKTGAGLALSAGLGALLFSVHPLRVESVAWATERRDVLSGFFYLSTVLIYLRRPRGWLALSLGSFALSLLSKAITISLPLTLLALDAYPLGRLRDGKAWREKGPFFILAFAAGVVGLAGQSRFGFMRPLEDHSLAARLAQSFFGLAFYLRKTLLPVDLSPLYELPARLNPWDAPFLLSAALIATITVGLILNRRRFPAGLAAWAHYVFALLPVLGLVQFGEHLAADRYTYLPSMAWSALAAAGLWSCWRKKIAIAGVSGLAIAAILSLGALTWRQTLVWRDSQSLWRHALAADPSSVTARSHLARVLDLEGRKDEAVAQYLEALELDAAHPKAHHGLADMLFDQGKLDEAIAHYQAAVKAAPRFVEARNNLGLALARQQKWEQAAEQYRAALVVKPRLASLRNNLGLALKHQGRLEEAITQFQEALTIKPDDIAARRNLNAALRAAAAKRSNN